MSSPGSLLLGCHKLPQQQQAVLFSWLNEEDILVFPESYWCLHLFGVVHGSCTAVVEVSGGPGGTSNNGVTKVSGLLLVGSSVIPNFTPKLKTL